MLEVFKRMWIGWNVAVKGIMVVQNAVLMGVGFIFGLGPVALVLKLMGRDLLDRGPADKTARTYWSTRDRRPMDMKGASRQF